MQLFQQSEGTAAQRRLFFHAVDATDGITAETGLTGAGRLSKNGAATAATSANISEIDSTNMPGRYYIEFTSGELDTVGIIEFRFKAAACAEVIARGQIVPFDPYDAVRAGLTALPNANAEAAGGLYTRGSGAGQINQNANGQVDSRTVAMAADVVTAAAIANGAIDAATFAAGAIDAAAIAADAIGSSELATSAVDEIVNAIWDELTTEGRVASSYGQLFKDNVNATIASRATPAQVNTEVDDVLRVDTQTLPGQTAPPLSPTLVQAITWLYKALRNRKAQTATLWSLMADDETTVDAKATVSDDGTTAIKQEIVSGP